MIFTPEDFNNTFFLTSDAFSVKANDARLVMMADTIKPSKPERVEEKVPVKTSVHQTQQQEDEAEASQVEKKAEQEKVEEQPISARTSAEPRRQPQETTQLAIPSQIPEKYDEPTPVDVAIVQPVMPTRIIMDSVAQEVIDPLGVNGDLLCIPFDVDCYLFPYAMTSDSLGALDSLNLAKVGKQGMSSYTYDSQKEGKSLPLSLYRSDGVFVLLAICFLVLAHIFRGGFSYFKENIMFVFSASKSERMETQTTSSETFNTIFLLFLSVLLISISLYEGLDRFMPLEVQAKQPFETIGLFILLMMVFIFMKLMLNKFIGYIFDMSKSIATWNRSYIVLLSLLGILCFLPTLMLVYSSMWSTIIIGFVLFLFLAVQLILFVRIILFFIGQKFNFLYLIAYLCTVEILPYIFLGIGLIYIYKIDVF